jgi:hypothetical protein
MIEKVDVSILITTKNYSTIEKQYKNFKNSSLKYEIIVVGPSNYFSKNTNFKFFESYCKPTQCIQIALDKAMGEWILLWVDDIFFCNFRKKNLDQLINLASKNKKKLISLRLANKINKDLESYRLIQGNIKTPLMPICAPIQKSVIKKIGYINKNFIATLFDLDLYLRMMFLGYKIKFSKIYIKENKNSNYSLNQDYLSHDRKYLFSTWNKKKYKVNSFSNNRLNIPQGPKGRWLFNNKYYHKYILSLYFLIYKKILPIYKIKPCLYKIKNTYFDNLIKKI